jgi:hypothetical protein
VNLLRWLVRYRRWPSRNQRDFMSRNPARRARVRELADRIIAELEEEQP